MPLSFNEITAEDRAREAARVIRRQLAAIREAALTFGAASAMDVGTLLARARAIQTADAEIEARRAHVDLTVEQVAALDMARVIGGNLLAVIALDLVPACQPGGVLGVDVDGIASSADVAALAPDDPARIEVMGQMTTALHAHPVQIPQALRDLGNALAAAIPAS